MAGPDGGFEVQFSAAPIVVTDPAGTSTSYLARVDEDTETVSVLPPAAFGAASEASATDRVALFLDASGDGIDVLANTPTRLGPLPAAYFISRITLADGNRAVLYGAVVVRPGDVNYVVYTDIGGDDADRARALRRVVHGGDRRHRRRPHRRRRLWPRPPPRRRRRHPDDDDVGRRHDPRPRPRRRRHRRQRPPCLPAPRSRSTRTGGSSSPTAPAVTLRASSADGFAYAEYAAVVGDDVLSVRVTELPAAFRWDQASAAEAEADRTGSTVVSSEVLTVNGSPSVRFTLDNADGDTRHHRSCMCVPAISCIGLPTPTAGSPPTGRRLRSSTRSTSLTSLKARR